MRNYLRLLGLLIFVVSGLMAQDLGRFPGNEPDAGGVKIELSLERGEGAKGEILVTFDALSDFTNHYHLYAPDSEGGVPLAVLVEGLATPKPWYTDAATKLDPSGNKIYVKDVIVVRVPVMLPSEDQSVTMKVSYLACSDTNICKQAVFDRRLNFRVPGVVGGVDPAQIAGGSDQTGPQTNAVLEQLSEAHQKTAAATGIAWRHVETVAEAEELIAAAHEAGQFAFLDFTGPSCVNCQDMAKNILILPQIRDAWNAGVPIEINTDFYGELAAWQLERFGTYTRPMYVRLDPDGTEEKWNVYFKSDNEKQVHALEGFLKGGPGQYTGSGDSWLQFIGLALLGGLFTLVMPCTYPMIPLTVNFFSKQASAGKKLVPLALAYSIGILTSFTFLGVLVGVLFKTAITNISGDPWVNLVIGVLFFLLGLSLLGVFFLRLPSSISARFGAGQAGYVGALLMGLTFAITAFTCTAPFAGAVLAEGAQSGDALRPAIGMAIYASVIAVPFFFLSMSPRLLERMPNAGSWMNEFKVVGGLVEIAAAYKFLAISDFAWGWGFIGRTTTLSTWFVLSSIAGFYILGLLRLKSDSPVQHRGPTRLILAGLFLALAVYVLLGLLGVLHLGLIESFFPGDDAPSV